MRRRLVLVFVAVSTLVALAFVVPLGFLVRRTAEDRSIDVARADAAAVVPALVAGGTRAQIETAVDATRAGRDGRMTVITSQGWVIGRVIEPTPRVDAALEVGFSDIGETPGGIEVVAAVASGPGSLSAIRVFVPDAERRKGQWRAWGALAGVGVALVAISVLVADRLSRSVVQPTQRLASAARRLGRGELEAKVDPDGPDELVELAGAFNLLGTQVSSMLERERELVAELSHRLRTPLTKLRMRLDQVDDSDLAAQLRDDLDDVTGVVNDLIKEARGAVDSTRGCDLARVVTERAEFWSVLAEDQQRPWRFEPGSDSIRVEVSASELGAAVDVLLENAFSHTPEGAALLVGYRADGERAFVWVGDGGDGFDRTSVERGASGAGSTGLGLDIARRLAEHAGGEMQVGTSEFGGALVTISLPCRDTAARKV
jgi:signal transduction histidine kinase